MTAYSATVTMTVPESYIQTAKALSRALDPDVGGFEAFAEVIDGHASYTTPCVPEFAQQVLYFKSNPAALHQAIAADYAARWPQFTPPTLAEVAAFCGAVEISTE